MALSLLHILGAGLALLGGVLLLSALTFRERKESANPIPPVATRVVRTPDPWAAEGRPNPRLTGSLSQAATSAAALLNELQLPPNLVEDILAQSRRQSYDTSAKSAAFTFMEAVLALLQRVSPEVSANPENKPKFERAIQLALGEATAVRLVWPTEGGNEPFNPQIHRTFPTPPPDQRHTVARLVRCGFETEHGNALAWVELQ